MEGFHNCSGILLCRVRQGFVAIFVKYLTSIGQDLVNTVCRDVAKSEADGIRTSRGMMESRRLCGLVEAQERVRWR